MRITVGTKEISKEVKTGAELQKFLSKLPPETSIYTYSEPDIYDVEEEVLGVGCDYTRNHNDYSEDPSYALYMYCCE